VTGWVINAIGAGLTEEIADMSRPCSSECGLPEQGVGAFVCNLSDTYPTSAAAFTPSRPFTILFPRVGSAP
jgi:hypothetical protein